MGSYGKVKLAKDTKTKKQFAIKLVFEINTLDRKRKNGRISCREQHLG
jgi:serine/threonine protein kinase